MVIHVKLFLDIIHCELHTQVWVTHSAVQQSYPKILSFDQGECSSSPGQCYLLPQVWTWDFVNGDWSSNIQVLTWLLTAEDGLQAQPPVSSHVEEVKEQFHTHEVREMQEWAITAWLTMSQLLYISHVHGLVKTPALYTALGHFFHSFLTWNTLWPWFLLNLWVQPLLMLLTSFELFLVPGFGPFVD